MRSLGRSGTTAMEFALIAIPFFFLTFGIFDLGRYGITVFSLRTLASETARQAYVTCYQQNILKKPPSVSTCTSTTLSTDTAAQQAVAPFLFFGGLQPDVQITPEVTSGVGPESGALVVTASQPEFRMLMPFWGSALNAPSESVALPF